MTANESIREPDPQSLVWSPVESSNWYLESSLRDSTDSLVENRCNIALVSESPGDLVKMQILFQWCGWGLRLYISNKSPDDAHSAGSETTL